MTTSSLPAQFGIARARRQTIAVHNGPLDRLARQWVAVLELGPRAALAGVSGLHYDGVATLTDEAIHVFVPRGAPVDVCPASCRTRAGGGGLKTW